MNDLNVVERAIAHFGSPIALSRELSYQSGRPVSRQRVHGWRLRGIFPKDMIPHVARITDIPLEEMLLAEPKPRPKRTGVQRALEKFDSSPKKFAAALSRTMDRKVTGQMVDGWLVRGSFPKDVVIYVSLVTGLPVGELMDWE